MCALVQVETRSKHAAGARDTARAEQRSARLSGLRAARAKSRKARAGASTGRLAVTRSLRARLLLVWCHTTVTAPELRSLVAEVPAG